MAAKVQPFFDMTKEFWEKVLVANIFMIKLLLFRILFVPLQPLKD